MIELFKAIRRKLNWWSYDIWADWMRWRIKHQILSEGE